MKTVRIITADERLLRELTLLLPKDIIQDESSPFVILDEDTAVFPAFKDLPRVLRISRTAKESKALTLRRPFTYFELREALDALFENATAALLTPTEVKLLALLEEGKGEPVSRERLMEALWGNTQADGLLNLYIHYLREKIEQDGKRRIFSVRGKGYFYQC